MDCPSPEGFHAKSDCKLIYGNKIRPQLTLVQFIYSRVKSKKRVENRKDEKKNNNNDNNNKQKKTNWYNG